MSIADDTTTTWLRRFRPGRDQGRRLVCFPHAGGSASFFHPVATRFGPAVDVVALQYPGRQDRRAEAMIDRIDTLADRVADELSRLTDKPTAFFGHSMGAVLAFETAWRLERTGSHAPQRVIASGRRAPGIHRPGQTVHQRDDDGLLAELRRLNGTVMALMDDEEIRRMALPAVRNDYRAIETYVCEPGRAIAAPITVFTGADDPQTTAAEAEAWRDHTTGDFRCVVFPGGHFFLAEHPGAVNDEVESELARLSAAGATR